jgi:phosphatidylglycerol---prolipoprotein diacylglyceryl transferase
MYPTLYHALLDLTGLSVPLLKFFNSFGFFVALAFVFASWTLGLELRRKERQGLLKPVKRTVVEGAKAGPMDYLLNGVIGFVIGWKLLHLVMDTSVLDDPQAFLLSGTGSIVGGLVGAAAMLAWRWNDSRKQHLEKPRKKEVQMLPHEHAGNITLTAAIWGIIGAKLFHWLENPGEFMAFLQAPSTSTLFSGLTMYGGLILAGAMVIRYFVRHGIPAFEGADSAHRV